MSKPLDAYYALALQLSCTAVNKCAGREEAQPRIDDAIRRTDEAILGGVRFLGSDIKLVVTPEYFLTGHPMGEGVAEWRDKAALEIDGPEYEALGAVAQKHKLFLAGNAYEKDSKFPDLFFQSSFVIAPSGDVVLRYRRLISLYSPSPYDVWDAYLDAYGADAVFPVADTDIGKLSAIASEEILYPELARCHAVRGAEVFVHSSSEAASNRMTIKNIAKRARALENLAYVVSANSAGIKDAIVLEGSTDYASQVVNYKGDLMVEAGYGESINACAEIDLAALRRYRARPGMGNILSRQPMQLYADTYASTNVMPANTLLKDGAVQKPERSIYISRQQEILERLGKDGLI